MEKDNIYPQNITQDVSIGVGFSDTESKEFKPIIFSAGFGRTASNKMLNSTCSLGLCSVHWSYECCEYIPALGQDGHFQVRSIPKSGILAHERLTRAFNVLQNCLADNIICPSTNRILSSLQLHIDNVMMAKDIDVIFDSPYTDFAEYTIESAEKFRGKRPVVILGERDPDIWASNRITKEQDKYYCRPEINDNGNPIGANLYLCLKTAVSNGLGSVSVNEVLVSPSNDQNFSFEKRRNDVSYGFRIYQDSMRAASVYNVNHFDYDPHLTVNNITKQIEETLTPMDVLPLNPSSISPKKDQIIIHQPKRSCMPDLETELVTGRLCNQLVVFLHFHKGGGTSMIEFMHSKGLRTDFRINSDPHRFNEFQDTEDIFVAKYKNNLRLKNNIASMEGTSSRASSTEFWWSLYERGLDVVNLEFNFLLPEHYFNVKSVLWTLTMLRNPWDRFRSTYERELSMRCSKNFTVSCYENYNLETWFKNGTGILTEKRFELWGGILHPNYYTRMLNGMADLPHIQLNKSHLDIAKHVLSTFNHVLILEDLEESNMQKLTTIFGRNSTGEDSFPSLSNNSLKNDPMYATIREVIDGYKSIFDDQNILDIELYAYARSIA
eukprot:CAMPEP_0184873724 /NCGR_PEP_ID=MMETSP0580-20130426/41999_1 /TAXON_ID=1118495 /ORGANISM="Dactyliosolen fragilissimus" /LENGTH=607 /DNA_ID=CAMNT_0027376659 /DNA_START=1020 /DNA_END=2843 /DNA_ORIENTATION=-